MLSLSTKPQSTAVCRRPSGGYRLPEAEIEPGRLRKRLCCRATGHVEEIQVMVGEVSKRRRRRCRSSATMDAYVCNHSLCPACPVLKYFECFGATFRVCLLTLGTNSGQVYIPGRQRQCSFFSAWREKVCEGQPAKCLSSGRGKKKFSVCQSLWRDR
ncbi:hypothetical protein BKA80DRAFT_39223 [Phyllosticta citrichinensis]